MKQFRNWTHLIMVLVILSFASSYPSLAVNTIYPNYDVTGHWKMVANEVYEFELIFQQNGGSLSGTMDHTNGGDPTDQISGSISPNGNIKFTRSRAGQWIQVYSGAVSSSDGSLKLQGTYTHDGSGSYPWSATPLARNSTSLIRISPVDARELLQRTSESIVDTGDYAHGGVEDTNVPELSGLWKMVGNGFHFDLFVRQTGSALAGTLTCTDRDEPVDAINGKVYPNWTVEFTRERPGEFTQFYTGSVSDINITLVMDGTFSHDGSGQYSWNATRERIDLENIRKVASLFGGEQGDQSSSTEGVLVDSYTPESDPYDLSGKWEMVANEIYEFDLDLQKIGYRITGTMTHTNGNDPVDFISGTVSSTGEVRFTRVRAGAFTQVYTGQITGSGDSMAIDGTYDHNRQGSYPWHATKPIITSQGKTSIDVDGSASQEGAAPGNHEAANVLVNVSKSFISSGPQAVGAVSIVTGLQASSFNVETMKVPPYGANVKMTDVSEKRPGQYSLTIVPESYQGTQHEWLEGTYQLRVTVSSEGIGGQVDIPLLITGRSVELTVSYNLTGIWAMSGNMDNKYNLDMQQASDRITGNITRINGHEPKDEVIGSVSADGKVEFTRESSGGFTQLYTGQVSGIEDVLFMGGTFSQDGQGQYPWNATLITRQKPYAPKSWSASWRDFLAGFGLRTQTYIDPAYKMDTFVDWGRTDLKSTFKWTAETGNVAYGVWQVSVFPFPIGEKNWSSPPGLVASGLLRPDQQEFDIDFGLFTPSKKMVGDYWKNTRPYLEFEKVALESIRGQITTEIAKPGISDGAEGQLIQVLGLINQASEDVDDKIEALLGGRSGGSTEDSDSTEEDEVTEGADEAGSVTEGSPSKVRGSGIASEWIEVSGGGVTDIALAATYFGDRVYLFSKGIEDRRIYKNVMDSSAVWSGWVEVPGGGTTDEALSAAVHENRLYLFSKGVGDRQVYANIMDSSGIWSGWTHVPNSGTTDAAVSATSFGGRLYIFSKGIDDRRIYMNVNEDGVWSGYTEVPGGGTTDSSLSSAAHGGKLYLFAKGIEDRRIYMNVMDSSAAWSGWVEVPGSGTTDTAVSAAIIGDNLWLFSKGVGDRQIYMNVLDESDNWSGWVVVPGGGITDCSPASSAAGNRIYVFAKGVEDRRIYMIEAPSSDGASAGSSRQVLKTQSDGSGLDEAIVSAASLQQTRDMTARMLPQEQRTYYVRIVALDSNEECIGLPSEGTKVVVGDPGLDQMLSDPELLTSSDSSPSLIAPWFKPKQLNTASGLLLSSTGKTCEHYEFRCHNWQGAANIIGVPVDKNRFGWSFHDGHETNFSFAVWQLVGKEQTENPSGSDIEAVWRNPEGLMDAGLLRTDDLDPDIWCDTCPKHSFVLDMTKYLPTYEQGNFTKADYYLRVIAMEPTDNPEIFNAYPTQWLNIHYESEPCGGQECPEVYLCDFMSLTVDVPCPDVKIVAYEPIHSQSNDWFYHYIVTKKPEFPWSELYTQGQPVDMTPKPANKNWWDYIEDAFGAIVDGMESIVNWVSQAWKDIKSFAVDVASSAACFGDETCKEVIRPFVETGLNTGLAALGIPPEIPNFDQLTSMGKGYLVKTLAAQAGVDPTLAEFVMTDENIQAGVEAFIDQSAEPASGDPLGLKLDPAYQYRPAYLMIELTNRHGVPTMPGTLSISDSQRLFRTQEPNIPYPGLDAGETLTVPVFLTEHRYDETLYGCRCPDTNYDLCRCNGPMGELNGADWWKIYNTQTDTFTVSAESLGTLDIAGMDQELLPEWIGHCSSPRMVYNQIGDNRDELSVIPQQRWGA